MPYVKTDWVDGVTPLNEANLDKMEQGIFDAQAKADGAVLSDSVVVAATRLVASKLLAGDAQPAFRILGNGKIEWGPGGGTAPDTDLSRAAGARLQTTGMIDVRSGAGGQITLGYSSAIPTIMFGGAGDMPVSRPAAGQLQVGSLAPVSNAMLSAVVAGNGIEFGHQNTAGYRSVLGADKGGGQSFLAFHAEAGTNNNTYRTRGQWGTILRANLAGSGGRIDVVGLSDVNLDNQAGVLLAGVGRVGASGESGIAFGTTFDVKVFRWGGGRLYVGGDPGDGVGLGITCTASGLGARNLEFGPADSAGSGFRQVRIQN